MAKKNITTIDKLAKMINKSFEKVATKEQVDGLESKVDGLESKVDGLNSKVNKIEKDVSEIKILVKDDHRKRIEKLETRVDYLENILDLPAKK